MKQQNIATLILVVSITVIAAYFTANALIKPPEGRTAQVEVAKPIKVSFPSPNEEPLSAEANKIYNKIFTPDAVNPTELIEVGTTTTNEPFTTETD